MSGAVMFGQSPFDDTTRVVGHLGIRKMHLRYVLVSSNNNIIILLLLKHIINARDDPAPDKLYHPASRNENCKTSSENPSS